jgi:GDP-L-fucose synthase
MTEDVATGDFFPAYEIVATMKQASEKIALLYAAHSQNQMETIIVRPSNSYGPRDDFNPETSKVLPALVSKFSKRTLPIEVWGDGTDIKDFVHIDDLVEGLIRAMAFGRNGNIYNIGSGSDSTIRGAVEILAKECKVSSDSINYLSEIPSMIPVRRISIEKSKKELGYLPRISLAEGLTTTLDWFRSKS